MQIANSWRVFALGEAGPSFAAPWERKRKKKWLPSAQSLIAALPTNPVRKKAERIFKLEEEFAGYG